MTQPTHRYTKRPDPLNPGELVSATYVVDVGAGATGGADTTTLEALCQGILDAIQADKDGAQAAWTDDTGDIFFRTSEYDSDAGTYTVGFVNSAGATYTPTGTPRPYGTDREVVKHEWVATNTGAGYSSGQRLQHIKFFDSDSGDLALEFWWNVEQRAKLSSAPPQGDLKQQTSVISVSPGAPVIISNGSTWSPPATATAVTWTSSGTGNTRTSPDGSGPLESSGGFVNSATSDYRPWTGVVFTAGPTGTITITHELEA